MSHPALNALVTNTSRPIATRPAFTLVELLVVIGIIALLISILLPSLSKARETAQRTACAAKLHSIMLAAELHRNNHHGYYPLAGVVSGGVPEDLNDAYAMKYDYYSFPNVSVSSGTAGINVNRTLATIIDSLASEMGRGSTTYGLQGLLGVPSENARENIMLSPAGPIKNFLCPSHSADPITISPAFVFTYKSVPQGGIGEAQSYIYNEFVLGMDDSLGRLGGRASGVSDPPRTMFAADGLGGKAGVARSGSNEGNPMCTVYNLRNDQPVSLADALADRSGYAGDAANFDLLRHKKQMNVAFCDGHVESRPITKGGLVDVRINNVKTPH